MPRQGGSETSIDAPIPRVIRAITLGMPQLPIQLSMPLPKRAVRSFLLLAATGAMLFALAPAAPTAAPETAIETPATTTATTPAAPTKPVAGKYIAADAIDLRALLPDPPAARSAYSNGEIEIIRAVQADAAPATIARAIAEDGMKVWLFADILGPTFTAADKPKTAAFIKQVERDSKPISDAAKKIWTRERPFDQSTEIKLFTEKPTSGSYPSGHTTRGAIWAETLALIAPEKAEAIRARARLIGLDRIVLGVHFPSDVAAGQALGKVIVERMATDPDFQADLAEVRSEWKH